MLVVAVGIKQPHLKWFNAFGRVVRMNPKNEMKVYRGDYQVELLYAKKNEHITKGILFENDQKQSQKCLPANLHNT